MNRRLAWTLLCVGLFWQQIAIAAEPSVAEILFVRRIAPLLRDKCLGCHGAEPAELRGKLDLRDQAGAQRGGESGQPTIVPGKPEQSPLVLAVTRRSDDWSAMPPKEADQLSAEQIGWLKTWIAAGAQWPTERRAAEIREAHAEKWSAEDGITVRTSGGLSADWTQRKYQAAGLWAYQPVKKPALREQGPAAIDALLAARLPAGLTVAPSADRRTLLRRATFDLTGLPPTPEESAAFLNDPRTDDAAFAAVVERLLASPHYGERMAQHWLDVVRYADSAGFANDYERGNAWRYRDYVVRAFNDDKPYDQFVREQIAGDEIDPTNPELLVATGFLRMGPWELTGMEVAKIARQRFLDDVTNSVGEAFLGQALQCARCHDHKFDPIPTRDYYSIQAIFATTQLAERPAAFLPTENVAGFEEKKYLAARQADYEADLKRVNPKATIAAARAWLKENGRDAEPFEQAVRKLMAQRKLPSEAELPLGAVRDVLEKDKTHPDLIPPPKAGFTPEDYGVERVARKGLERLRWELERYEPFALAVYSGRTPGLKSVYAPLRMPQEPERGGELEASCILTGGDPFARGAAVQPGVLSVVAAEPPAITTELHGRRKEFAAWLTTPQHPLTSRVLVNRVWQWHFGEGLAGNPNNFGSTGKRPTHPELLDWLAATFVEQGWSVKWLHRAIMNSAAYRRGSQHPQPQALAEQDPQGTAYAVFRPRRLSAEELRDAMLAATGELNRTLGGIPNRPEINRESALQPRQVMGTFAAAWVPNPLPAQRHRRSLYALKLRGLMAPELEVFNAPAPDFSCERRETSTVTPQVFTLFNSEASHARALALAARSLRESKSAEGALKRCFALTFHRSPMADELRACLQHWRELEPVHAEIQPARPTYPREVRREAVEENTGEKFSFSERLHAYRDFVPDLQPADVDARTRALADVCLVLLNANEFVYVY